MPSRTLGHPLIWLDSTTSTMDEVGAREPGAREGLTVAADQQTGGRGRLGRSWFDQPGGSLLFSTLLRPHCPPEEFQLFPLAAGLAVAEAVWTLLGVDCRLKWPNDLLIDDQKIAGVLVTSKLVNGAIASAIVGIGVNVVAAPRVNGVDGTALQDHTDQLVDRRLLLDRILTSLGVVYRALADGHRTWIVEEWMARAVWLDQLVSISGLQGEKQGRYRGIDETGRLLLEIGTDRVDAISVGDVSRGIRPAKLFATK